MCSGSFRLHYQISGNRAEPRRSGDGCEGCAENSSDRSDRDRLSGSLFHGFDQSQVNAISSRCISSKVIS